MKLKDLLIPLEVLKEGWWTIPKTPTQIKKIETLLQEPIPANKAKDILYDVLGSDRLFDRLYDTKGNEDVRHLVIDELEYIGVAFKAPTIQP